MGHYGSIKFEAKLSEIGVEVLNCLAKYGGNWQKVAEELTYYPFIEVLMNRSYKFGFGYGKVIDNVWKVDAEEKNLFYCWLPIDFLLCHMISEPCVLIYSDEHMNWKPQQDLIEPRKPIIDWDRKYGDPTGYENLRR